MIDPGGYAPGAGPAAPVDLDESGMPVLPTGPGVTPPFPAPPTDRNRRGLWIGLGVGALVLVLCCGGGLFGVGVVLVNGTDQVKRQAANTVDQYYGALVTRDYEQAYGLLCPAITQGMSAEEFVTRERRNLHPVQYSVGAAELGNAIVVPTTVTYEGGAVTQRRIRVQQAGSGTLKVCGGAD
jgi:hypothetical protein